VSQPTACEFGNVERSNVKKHQTICTAAKSPVEEIAVAGDQRGASQSAKQRDDLVVVHSFAPDVAGNLTEMNSPRPQPCPLTLEDILVEHDHAGSGLSKYSSACSAIARPAMRIASAIAGREILPWHSWMISSRPSPQRPVPKHRSPECAFRET
jgi:hypothetical protein